MSRRTGWMVLVVSWVAVVGLTAWAIGTPQYRTDLDDGCIVEYVDVWFTGWQEHERMCP